MYVPGTDPDSIDDVDTMSICIAPIHYSLGIDNWGSRGTIESFVGVNDDVYYELQKFIGLLVKGNPNVIPMLWLHDSHYLKTTPQGEHLLANRRLFSSRQVFKAFSGYGKGQLYKMTHFSFKGYMGEKRKALVTKHGYDTKNAAHCIRLMRMAIEFLDTGEFTVLRPDAAELLQIKKGAWTLEQVQAEAEALFVKAEDAYNKCSLPEEPSMAAVNALCARVICEWHGLQP
jgi:predicted nucleotidyltransferase